MPTRKPKLRAKLGNWDIDADLLSEEDQNNAASDDVMDLEYEAALGKEMSEERRLLIEQVKQQKILIKNQRIYAEQKALYEESVIKLKEINDRWEAAKKNLIYPTLARAGGSDRRLKDMKYEYEYKLRLANDHHRQELAKVKKYSPPTPVTTTSQTGNKISDAGQMQELVDAEIYPYYTKQFRSFQRENLENFDKYSRPIPTDMREEWVDLLGQGTAGHTGLVDQPEAQLPGQGKESTRTNVRYHYPRMLDLMTGEDVLENFVAPWKDRDHPDFPILKGQGLPPLNKRYEQESNHHIGMVQQRIERDRAEEAASLRYVEKPIHNPSPYFDNFWEGHVPPYLKTQNEFGEFDPDPFTAPTIHRKLRPRQNTKHKLSELHPEPDDDSWYLHRWTKLITNPHPILSWDFTSFF